MTEDHNREFMRSNISIAAQIIPEQGEPIPVMVKDLSLHGIMVHAGHHLGIGAPCQIRIQFGHYKYELPIIAKGSVVRRQGEYFAIKFDSVGFESNEELESMILSHSPDPEQCLKEFAQEELFFDPLSANDYNPNEPH